MKSTQAIAKFVQQRGALTMRTAVVRVAPASHVVTIDFGDGAWVTVPYDSGLALAVGNVVIVLCDQLRSFVIGKPA